jgi:hypothetical protein
MNNSPADSLDWKAIICSRPDWPATLHVPQPDQVPEGSECILDCVDANEHWHWELWRQPDDWTYYLAVIRNRPDKFSFPRPAAVALSVQEVFQFLTGNLLPPVVLQDYAATAPFLNHL